MDLARFHRTLNDVANSTFLRDMADYEKKKKQAQELRCKDPEGYRRLRNDLAEIRDRLINAAFAKPSKAKQVKENGIVTEVGPVAAKSIVDFFASATGRRILQRLQELNIQPKSEKVSIKKSTELPLAGKTFVLTGTLPTMTRGEATDKIEGLGGNVSSSVSKKTDYVLAGAEPGSKFDKAKELGILIIDEAEFRKMIRR